MSEPQSNIDWPADLHWLTIQLLLKFPVLKSSDRTEIYWQKTILESELDYIQWLRVMRGHLFTYTPRELHLYEIELLSALLQIS
jgi:hypothetical protein